MFVNRLLANVLHSNMYVAFLSVLSFWFYLDYLCYELQYICLEFKPRCYLLPDKLSCCHFAQISELHKALAEVKSLPRDITHIDPRNIRASHSVLKNTEKGTSNTRGSFRSRATLPENMSQLSNCQFPRRDQLRESLSAPVPLPVPNAASTSAEEGQLQPSLPSSHLVFLAHLVEKSKMLPSDSIFSIGERLKRHEIHPHILGVQAWSKRRSCGPQWIRPKQFPQTGQ